MMTTEIKIEDYKQYHILFIPEIQKFVAEKGGQVIHEEADIKKLKKIIDKGDFERTPAILFKRRYDDSIIIREVEITSVKKERYSGIVAWTNSENGKEKVGLYELLKSTNKNKETLKIILKNQELIDELKSKIHDLEDSLEKYKREDFGW